MPKNKRHKYERVRQLPNVIISADGEPLSVCSYPWYADRFTGMPTVLELGCGKGEHSLAFAADDPKTMYVGVDYKSHRMCVGAEQAAARGLENLFFLRARVEHLRAFFRPHAIASIWLTFPDPHIKQRKAKCRLSADPFLEIYADLLVPGGNVYLKTDSDALFQFTRQAVRRSGGRVLMVCGDIHGSNHSLPGSGVVSAYEQAAVSQGAAIRFLAFRLD
jgi:tRNA (guanine-N7-)-methyltransferase